VGNVMAYNTALARHLADSGHDNPLSFWLSDEKVRLFNAMHPCASSFVDAYLKHAAFSNGRLRWVIRLA
jgi:hypothetical protein